MHSFAEAYKNLNPRQKEAVDAIDGPVMVVAGPGTGKTQVLALRIANILTQTDTPPSGVLCLTFTNAGVHAMRERLLRLMGSRGSEVGVYTFHRFALGIIEKHYALLEFDAAPVLMSDAEAVALADEILENNEWEHIRPRGDSAKYFGDLKSLISLLKREHMSPSDFLAEVERDIEAITNDEDNISSRGPTKGQLKKEAQTKIASLKRAREVVRFYEIYEETKEARALMDYDDVLTYAVRLATESEDVRATIRENYLYVLVDEHQDSSGVQNAFLEAVWADTEHPNIFVVGDDRQLIYGFGGASLEQFTNFRTLFGKAHEITLVDNYRSTQTILDTANGLLQSSITKDKLVARSGASEQKIRLLECQYQRDEIILAAEDIKKQIAAGAAAEDCAILVPKNYQARSAAEILREHGLPVAAAGALSFFAQPETATMRSIIASLSDPYDATPLGALLLDSVVGIPPLEAHAYLRANMRKISLTAFIEYSTAHLPTEPLVRFGMLMSDLLECAQSLGLHGLIQRVGEELFFKNIDDHDLLIRRVEIIRTFLHLLTSQQEQHPHLTLAEFSAYLDRLEHYGHELPLAVFSGLGGVRILTLHGSKGLEFKNVYIAHLDEASIMRGRKLGFTLPERVQSRVEAKDEMVARRELYVAITRAKERCTLSYALQGYSGGSLEPAPILADLPEELVERSTSEETQKLLLGIDPQIYIRRAPKRPKTTMAQLAALVKEEYVRTNVSVTLLNNFFECPWKWYFRNMLQMPERKTESLLLGSAVHTGIEYILKHGGSVPAADLHAALVDCMEKEYVSDQKIIARLVKVAEKILGNFVKNYLPRFAPDRQSERSVSYRDPRWPHLSCYGKIDLTERLEENVVEVTDFKTGGGKTKSSIEKLDEEGRPSQYLRQLAMYSYLIQGAEKGTEVRSSRLMFLEEDPESKDAVYTTSVTAEDIGLLERDIRDYDALMQSGEWVNRPCEAKLYGSSKECEYCAKAKELYSEN